MAPQKNKFGHTVLNSSDRNINEDSTDVTIDEQGLVVASPKYSVFDSQEFNEFAEKFTETSKVEIEPEKIIVNSMQGADFQKLLSELDEMDGKKSDPPTDVMKACCNSDCLYALPKDAKFCLKCGTPQLTKFCIECGHKFSSLEKFCPDCGTKRN
jgi:RNA polymerase subunit RPABC4/transcription elongation factor Spt4